MLGKVFFTDEHIEEVTMVHAYSNDEVVFSTASGQYMFRHYKDYLYASDTWYDDWEFRKYNGEILEWLTTFDIYRLELYEEGLFHEL